VTAAELHRQSVLIDGVDVSIPSRERFLRMRAAGLTAVNVTTSFSDDFTQTMRNIAAWNRLLARNDDVAVQVRSTEDIAAAKRGGRVGVIYGFQNTSPLEDDFEFIGIFRDVGVRIVQLAYMYQNLVGAGCLEESDSGLTSYGRDVVRELNRQGLVIDLSHCGPKTTADAIALSEQPVVLSHVAARALCESPRNRTDDELRRIADSGGVAGIVTFPRFLKQEDPTIEDWFRHLEHVLEVVGPDHVGIGTDFIEGQPDGFGDRAYYHRPHPPGLVPQGWPWPYPDGIASCDDYPNITAGLVERGYDPETIRKILGGNFVRVFGEVWGAA